MARTLTEIYTIAKEYRNQYLELTEIENTSKMSIMDAFTWVVSACIWTFDNMLDVFKVDLAKDLQSRINGTPAYFANALLKYQSGDELVINEEGTAFSYANIDEKKRVVTKVSYSEVEEKNYHDKLMLLKIATGEAGAYQRVSDEELINIRAYMDKILFAGQHATIVSRNGDVLIPRLTVYYDGAISENEAYKNIENSLNAFIADLVFDGAVYLQKIVDAIQRAEHITDVHIDYNNSSQGVFVAQYDDDGHLITDDNGNVEQRINRFIIPNSGYLKQSTKSKEEKDLPTWRESITLKLETYK